MWRISRAGAIVGARDHHVSGISDLDAVRIGGIWHLYVTTRSSPGVTVYQLGPDADVLDRTDDRQATGGDGLRPEASALLSFGDTLYLASLGRNFEAYPLFAVNGKGDLDGSMSFLPGNGPTSSMVALDQVKLGAADYLVAAHHGPAALTLHRVGGDMSLTNIASASLGSGSVTAVTTVDVGSRSFALAATHSSAELQVFEVSAQGFDPVSQDASLGTIGLGNISCIETVRLEGATFVIVAGAGSSSLSVFRIGSDGSLSATDHVLDSHATRFQNAAELAVATLDGRVFVAAAGSDDGLSLLELMPEGQLVLRGTVADRADLTLRNVSGLTMLAQDGRLAIFAASETETGITRFTVDPGNPGTTLIGGSGHDDIAGGALDDILIGAAGNDVLTGNGGEDVLIDGAGTDRMRGGDGADLFVLKYDRTADTILDFEAGSDRIDLSAWQMLRQFSQVVVTSTANGAVLRYGAEELTVISDDGKSLNAAKLGAAASIALDHALNDGTALPSVSLPEPPPARPNTTGRQSIEGGSGSDRLMGTRGGDRIEGGNGNDTLIGGAGGDRLIGGSGRDVADYGTAPAGVTVNLGSPGRNTGDARGDSYSGIEIISGSRFADRLTGNGADNVFRGAAGTDRLMGKGGDDALAGGGGSDRIRGGSGNDTLAGGAGGDALGGGSGRDRLLGHGGRDRLSGAGGDDTLNGGGAADTLNGGKGDDRLTGGGGADHFVFTGGRDRITDFRHGTDTLDFHRSLWGGGRMSEKALVAEFAERHGGTVTFDFGHGDVLSLDWSGALGGLVRDIEL
ncbi:calcium-binding protein [Sulfitobacter sp. LCG007]